MMPQPWPPATEADRTVAVAPRATRRRLAVARTDFFLDPELRLSEHERALMGRLLDGVLGLIATEIRAALPPVIAEAAGQDEASLRSVLTRAGLLDREELVAMLLAAADEQRIHAAMEAQGVRGRAPFVQGLTASAEDSIATAAMELVLARGRRRDHFGQPSLDFDDLPADLAVALAHGVAAALRARAGQRDDVDQAFALAVERLLERFDEANCVRARIAALVRALGAAGQLGERELIAAAIDGEAAILAATLAELAGIARDDAWAMLVDPGAGQLGMLLRAAGLARQVAAQLVAILADVLGIDDPAAQIARFDTLRDADVAAAVSWLRCAPAYRAAVERIERL